MRLYKLKFQKVGAAHSLKILRLVYQDIEIGKQNVCTRGKKSQSNEMLSLPIAFCFNVSPDHFRSAQS